MDKAESLELSSLYKKFKSGESFIDILKDLNWKIKAGESIAITGPSGIGKSTLLHILGALDRPDKGELFLKNKSIFKLDDNALARIRNAYIGFVFQFHHLLAEFTALENVMMPALISGVKKKEALEKARDLLDSVGLFSRLHHRAAQLSGGEQQRAALARALVMEPSFLLADEPTGNLDIQNSRKIHELLLRLHKEKGCTLIVVTHNQEFAGMMQKQVSLVDGKIVELDKR